MTQLRLIVGLGNPGSEYDDTRHNAGFWFVDALAQRTGGSLRHDRGFHGRVAKVQIDHQPVFLCEPDTYMNRSGIAVSALATFYKISAPEILVVHDELDFLPGVVKLKQGGSSGGHNGLKDIHARIGAADFWRLRLGIGHPRTLALAQSVADFVLHRPSRDHRDRIDRCIDDALDVIGLMVAGDFTRAMQQLHARRDDAA